MSTRLTISKPSPHDAASAEGVAAVDRALAIVGAIAISPQPIKLAELSRATGFYKSTLLRLLVSLERSGLVVRLPDGRYGLGAFCRDLGQAYEASYRIDKTLLPLLQNLVEEGSESSSFHSYRDAETRQCLLRVDSHHSTLDRIRVGDLLPLDRGAAGRVLTAYLVRGESPAKAGLTFLSMGERDPNCAAVASPVFGADGVVRGAISLSGPKERFTPAAIKKASRQAMNAAKSATEALGGRWPSTR